MILKKKDKNKIKIEIFYRNLEKDQKKKCILKNDSINLF